MITPQSRTIEILRGRYDPVTDTGYMGYVPAIEFITGEQLIDQLGFHDGVDQNSDCGWLKFYVGPNASCNTTDQQKILYIAKMSFKHTVSWDYINSIGLVHGDTHITIQDNIYSVRLMTGGGVSPGTESEWNELLYRVHMEQPDGKPNWETFDPALDITVISGNGRYAWCQETSPTRPIERIVRGIGRFAIWGDVASFDAGSYVGWRPVLELVE